MSVSYLAPDERHTETQQAGKAINEHCWFGSPYPDVLDLAFNAHATGVNIVVQAANEMANPLLNNLVLQ